MTLEIVWQFGVLKSSLIREFSLSIHLSMAENEFLSDL